MLRSNPVAAPVDDDSTLPPAPTPFDFYLDAWNESAARLQASGDLVLIRLPFGFLGGLVIRGRDVWMETVRCS